MISGHVTAKISPIIRVRVVGPISRDESDLDAVVDTGFTGEVMLPRSAIRALELEPKGVCTGILATGKAVSTKVYRAIIEWNGERRPVDVIPTDGDPLLGTKLMCGFQLVVNFVEGGAIVLHKLTKRG